MTKNLQRICSLVMASALGCFAQILPPPSPFPPLVRTFTVTAYSIEGMESVHSEPLVTSLRFPLTIAWDASPSPDVAGYLVYMRALNRTNIYDAGTNHSLTIAPTNQPSPPLRLRIAVEGTNFVAEPAGRARFYRSMIQTSTNLVDWDFMAGLKTTSGKEP